MDSSLQTARLLLRPINTEEDELEVYLGWLRDVESNSFIQSARVDYGIEELIEFIRTVNSDVNAILFGLFLKSNFQFIGTLKIQPIDFTLGTAWLGIMIGNPEFRGRGYGREAVQEVLKFLFNSLKLKEVFLGVDLKNFDAIALYETLGFSEHLREENSMTMIKKISPNFE
jgi:RimJ/RimL family protein N-acetyltransferase